MLNLTTQNPNKDKHNLFQINPSNHNHHLINNKLKMISVILAIFQNLQPQQPMTTSLEILDSDLMTPNNNKPSPNNNQQINFHKILNQILSETFNNLHNHINKLNPFNNRHNHFSNNLLNNRWLSSQNQNLFLRPIY